MYRLQSRIHQYRYVLMGLQFHHLRFARLCRELRTQRPLSRQRRCERYLRRERHWFGPCELWSLRKRLWSDRDRARALGRQAFEGVRAHYSIQQSAARLIQAYQATLAERRTSVA